VLGGEYASRLARRVVGKSVAWATGLALFCALVSAVPASAQIGDVCSGTACATNTAQNSIGGTAVTATQTLGTLQGTINGNGGQGYFVGSGGVLTANGATLQNFVTKGGAGSGGGLGAGGAIFIDTGGKAVLNNTNFTHNSVIGGTGGDLSTGSYGGTLNGITTRTTLGGGITPTNGNGPNGADGTAQIDSDAIFGDGKGNGAPAIAATVGSDATNGFGGNGGNGGTGGNGWNNDPIDTDAVNAANEKIIADALKVGVDSTNIAAWISSATADTGSCANAFSVPLCGLVGAFNLGKAILAGVGLTADSLGLDADRDSLQINNDKLGAWITRVTEGLSGNGSAGGAGANGGAGSNGFGGGAGGQGGAYGLDTLPTGTPLDVSKVKDGVGGAGGAGGNGGFGGGGGSGGAGFGAGLAGCGTNGCTSTSGAGGAGGKGGFGGGAGSKGGVTGGVGPTGGGGGGGYGGSIFLNSGGSLTITGTSTFNGGSAVGGDSLNGGVGGGSAGTDIFMMQGSTLILQANTAADGIGNVITFNGTIADNSNSSIGSSTEITGGAYLTVGAGMTVFNGKNTYSGQTIITGGDILGGVLNTGANTAGTPNYLTTDGALRANDGTGLPSTSFLTFAGANRFTGGVLEITGTSTSSSSTTLPTSFTRFVSSNPNPFGGGTGNGVQWVGSGGFAALKAPLTVTLNNNAQLFWGLTDGFVGTGYSLIFGSADSNNTVTFTNDIDIGNGCDASNTSARCTGAGAPGANTSASILVGNNGVSVAGSTAIMSGVLSGTGDLSIGGGGFNGTLELTAAETYTGGTYVHSGTLALVGNGSIAFSSGLFLDAGAALDISQSPTNSTPGVGNAVVPSLNGAGTIVLGNKELEVVNGGTFSGSLVDGAAGTHGSLIVDGAAAGSPSTLLTLTAANTYTGDTIVKANATLALDGNGSIANSSPVQVDGTFDITQLAVGTSIQSLSGTGTTFIGANVLQITNGSTTFSGNIQEGAGGIVNGTGGSLWIAGGVQTLSGANNNYTGVTLISPAGSATSATLALSGIGSIATSSGVAINTGGTFDISQTTTGATIQTLAGAGTVALGSKTLTVNNASTEYDGTIADGGIGGGTGGNLALTTTGTLTLSGTNTYTGTTTVGPGTTLALIGTGSISQSSNVIVNSAGPCPGATCNGTFDISQTAGGAAIKTLTGNGQVLIGGQLFDNTGTLLNTDVLLITNGASTTSSSTWFSGDINDGGLGTNGLAPAGIKSGGMLVIGGGTETLSGANTYTGATIIAPLVTGGSATLALAGTGSILSSSEVGIGAGGTFDISQTTGGASIQTLLGLGTVALGNQTLTITNGSTTYGGVIADGGIASTIPGHVSAPGNLTVSGGTQTLMGANTYTGVTTIAPAAPATSATLALAGNGSIATSSKVAIGTGGTFDISQTAAGAAITTLADATPGVSGNVALGAQTLAVTNGSTAFSGVISDGGIGGGTSGNFEVTGGTQTLAGINTYTGFTAIAPNPAGGSATLALTGAGSVATSSEVFIDKGGTFDISGSTAAAGVAITTLSGNAGSSVVLGGQTLTVTAGGAGADGSNPAGSYWGVISGAGGVAVTGGHQELLGQNTYQGGTSVTNGAVLSINNSASLGAASSTLTLNNGTLVVDASITIPQSVKLLGAPPGTDLINLNSNNVTLSGTITGPGVLTVANGGSLNLTGTVNGIGGIVLGPGVTFTATAGANAGIGTTPITLVPTSGAAVDLFTGTVHVVGPLDVINGATPELIIQQGEALAGVGSVNATVIVQSGGAKAPGDGPGTIFVNSNVINMAGSTYTVEIDGPLNSATNCSTFNGCAGQYSSIVVTGGSNYTANGVIVPILRGIDAPANNNYTAPVGSFYTAVQASGGVLGSFTSLTQPAAGAGLAQGTRFDALYFNIGAATSMTTSALTYSQNAAGNPTAVNLWVTPASYQNLKPWNISLTQNQNQVAYALDALRGVNDLNPAASLPAGLKNNAYATWDFGQLYPQQPSSLPGIFNTLSGEVAADAKLVSFQLTNEFLSMMLDSSVNGRHGGAGALAFAPDEQEGQSGVASQAGLSDAALGYAQANKAPAPGAASFDQRWSTWASAFGHGLNASGDAAVGSSDLSAHSYGVGGGFDYRWNADTVTGVAIAGGNTSWSVAQSLGTGRSDVFEGGVYGSTHFGSVYLAGAASAANHWMATDRNAFASDHLQSKFNAQNYGGRVEAGWRYVLPWITATPYVAGTAQRYSTPTYSETDMIGGGFGLQYASSSATEIRGEVGARLDSRFDVSSDATLILRGRGAYAYQMVNNPALLATFQAALAAGALPGSAVGFTVNGAVLPKNLALASAGAELHFASNWSVAADFRGEFGSGSMFYSGTGSVKYGW
jgi:autotransporter-associated beta strand protein